MADDELAIIIEGRREDWPGGARTLTPWKPCREPSRADLLVRRRTRPGRHRDLVRDRLGGHPPDAGEDAQGRGGPPRPQPRPSGQHRAEPVRPRRGPAGARRSGRADRHHYRGRPTRVRHLRGAGRVRAGADPRTHRGRAQGRTSPRPQGRQEVRAVESPGAAGPPRHLGVRTVQRTRYQAGDALQVHRTGRASCASRARRSSPPEPEDRDAGPAPA